METTPKHIGLSFKNKLFDNKNNKIRNQRTTFKKYKHYICLLVMKCTLSYCISKSTERPIIISNININHIINNYFVFFCFQKKKNPEKHQQCCLNQ